MAVSSNSSFQIFGDIDIIDQLGFSQLKFENNEIYTSPLYFSISKYLQNLNSMEKE